MKAVKTPSGKWRVRPVDHYEIVNGKRRAVLASITRDTKREAMLAAYAYKDSKDQERARGVTVAAAVRACGLPHFRFHDLRAYAVSIRHALGIPDVYIMRDGGYRTDAVMKQVYRRAMTDKADEFAQIALDHFDGMVE